MRTLRGIALIAVTSIALPIAALATKIPWRTFGSHLGGELGRNAFVLSMWTSIVVLVFTFLLGVPLAWTLAHSDDSLTRTIRAVVLAPLVLPPTVAGVALLALYSPNGFIGKYVAEQFNVLLAFNKSAIVLAGIFVALPYFVLVMESAFRNLSRDYEDQARLDGASTLRILFAVALPQCRSAITTGLTLSWARSIGEFGATMMFAGMTPGRTLTLPMAVYMSMDIDMQDAYAISGVMIGVAVILMVLLRKHLTFSLTR